MFDILLRNFVLASCPKMTAIMALTLLNNFVWIIRTQILLTTLNSFESFISAKIFKGFFLSKGTPEPVLLVIIFFSVQIWKITYRAWKKRRWRLKVTKVIINEIARKIWIIIQETKKNTRGQPKYLLNEIINYKCKKNRKLIKKK